MSPPIPRRRLKNAEPPGKAHDQFRGSASERGYDWQWSKPGGTRDQILERDENLCQMCLIEGGLVEAMKAMSNLVADHKIPAHVRPDLMHDVDNGQCLCARHNAVKAVADNELYGGPNVPVEALTVKQMAARRKVGA